MDEQVAASKTSAAGMKPYQRRRTSPINLAVGRLRRHAHGTQREREREEGERGVRNKKMERCQGGGDKRVER